MGKLRKPARPGLSYVDANKGRIIEVEADVLDIKAEIESRWPELKIHFDEVDEYWVVVEHCKDGVDRLVTTTSALDERLVKRIAASDTHKRGQEDIEAAIDRENAAYEKKLDDEFSEKIGDAGERLLWALNKGGVNAGVPQVFIPRDVNEPPESSDSS